MDWWSPQVNIFGTRETFEAPCAYHSRVHYFPWSGSVHKNIKSERTKIRQRLDVSDAQALRDTDTRWCSSAVGRSSVPTIPRVSWCVEAIGIPRWELPCLIFLKALRHDTWIFTKNMTLLIPELTTEMLFSRFPKGCLLWKKKYFVNTKQTEDVTKCWIWGCYQ